MTRITGFAHLDAATGKVLVSELPTEGFGTSITAVGTLGVATRLDLISGSFSLNPDGNGGLETVYGNNAPAIQGINTTFQGLTDLSFNDLATIGSLGLGISGSTSLVSLRFLLLQTCVGGFLIEDCSSLTDLYLPVLHQVFGGFTLSNIPIAGALTLDSINYVYGTMNLSALASVTSIDISALVSVGVTEIAPLRIAGNTLLASIASNFLVHAGGILIQSNPALTSFAVDALFDCDGDFSILTNDSLTSVSATTLVPISGSLVFNGNAILDSISFPSLIQVLGTTQVSNTAFTAFAINSMTTGGIFNIATNASLVSVSFSSLQTASGDLTFTDNPVLTTISLNGMVTYLGNFDASSGNGAIVTATLGTIGTLKAALDINLNGQALTSAHVNAILALLVSLDGTGGTTTWGAGRTLDVSGGTSGAPTGQGVVDFGVLTGRGATVTTN